MLQQGLLWFVTGIGTSSHVNMEENHKFSAYHRSAVYKACAAFGERHRKVWKKKKESWNCPKFFALRKIFGLLSSAHINALSCNHMYQDSQIWKTFILSLEVPTVSTRNRRPSSGKPIVAIRFCSMLKMIGRVTSMSACLFFFFFFYFIFLCLAMLYIIHMILRYL